MKEQIEERYEIAEIISDSFDHNGEKWDASDFEWAAHCIQMADYRKVPEGAMILTRAELDALNKYQERFKGQDAEAVIATEVAKEIFAEIEEGIKAAVSALQFENNPIHRRVKHETYSSLMRFIKTIEKKYTEEGK